MKVSSKSARIDRHEGRSALSMGQRNIPMRPTGGHIAYPENALHEIKNLDSPATPDHGSG